MNIKQRIQKIQKRVLVFVVVSSWIIAKTKQNKRSQQTRSMNSMTVSTSGSILRRWTLPSSSRRPSDSLKALPTDGKQRPKTATRSDIIFCRLFNSTRVDSAFIKSTKMERFYFNKIIVLKILKMPMKFVKYVIWIRFLSQVASQLSV